MTSRDAPRFATLCIHAGQQPDPGTGALVTPIFQTSTFAREALGAPQAFEYSRVGNPTRTALETKLAALEGGRAAFAFASGMAAIAAVLARLGAGDHVIVTANTYGGTSRLFEQVIGRHGVRFSDVDTSDLAAIDRVWSADTRLVFVETPTNPLMRVSDIGAIADLAHERDAAVVVDNTFASPCLQRPLALGADLVVHSTTKYLNGHSDSVGGVVIATRDGDVEWLRFVQRTEGAILGPFDAWLVLRGTKTLALRMARHSSSGLALATWLHAHARVTRVLYPGLPDAPRRDLADRQMPHGFGGMLAFELESVDLVRGVIGRLRLITLADSLGGVETLVSHPASMTHAAVPPDVRAAQGLSDRLLRLSVGLEDPDDLIDDLRQALD